MCPLSGMVQFLIVIVTLILLCHGVFSEWTLKCEPRKPVVHMYKVANITCDIKGPQVYSEHMLVINSEDSNIVKSDKEIWLKYDINTGFFPESFNITGQFLGKTKVSVKIQQRKLNTPETEEILEVTVTREKRTIDHVFHSSVAILVSLMYINFGCALNWKDFRANLRKPIGPMIGFFAQFIIMPLISFTIGKILFHDNVAMQLGIFFTGVAPSGGASNMWTLILDGNIDLSVTMTTISTFASFAMMPIWLFSLGRVIFHDGDLQIPYDMITAYALALVIPLFIGYLIQRYMKRVSNFLVRILKGFSSLLLIFIIVFAIVTNLYLFKLFSWEIVAAGMVLPWLGYSIAWVLANLFKQPHRDCLAIAIETGIQNTGISIFMLKFSLDPPESDITTVVPVAVAIMTPIPLLILYIYQKVQARCCMKHGKLDNSELNSPLSELDIDNNFHTKGPKSVSTIS